MRRLQPRQLWKTRLIAAAQRAWAPLAQPFGIKRAQALVEFAIFGTVLLFVLAFMLRYGMGAVYKQSSIMRGFRHGFVRASSSDSARSGSINPGWTFENSNPPLPSNRYRNVNYTLLEDKPIISTSGILPIPGRVTVGITVDAVRSIDMYGGMVYGDRDHLPRVEYEINGRRYSFTTADYREYTGSSNMRQKETIPDWDGTGPYWRWNTVSSVDEGQRVDVDGDGYEEYVMEKSGNILRCIDYQEGEINQSPRIGDVGREKGGLEPDYDKELLVTNSSLVRQEDGASIITVDDIDAREIIYRTFTTRPGTYDNGVYNVTDEFTIQQTSTWETPLE